MIFQTTDLCIGFWAKACEANVVPLKHGARVLEIGCCEGDWIGPMAKLRPDLTIIGLDWRAKDCQRPDGNVLMNGDVMTIDFDPEQAFDAIVSISTIEHIGLGAYDHDPFRPDGDIVTMKRCARWLKPDGWMYFDVPYGEKYVTNDKYRRYDNVALFDRLTEPFECELYRHIHTPDHPDAPYIALVVRP